MNRPRLIMIVLAAVLVAGVVAYLCIPKEPRYQGRKLSQWTGDMYSAVKARESFYNTHPPQGPLWDDSKWREGSNALRQIGTNAVPWLLRMAGGIDSQRKLMLVHWLEAHPRFHIHIRTSQDKRNEALFAFLALGEKAKPAEPTLIEWTYDKKAERRLAALEFLTLTKPDKETLLPVLRRLMEDEDLQIEGLAALTMRRKYPQETVQTGVK